jgi:hypothetical protein
MSSKRAVFRLPVTVQVPEAGLARAGAAGKAVPSEHGERDNVPQAQSGHHALLIRLAVNPGIRAWPASGQGAGVQYLRPDGLGPAVARALPGHGRSQKDAPAQQAAAKACGMVRLARER